MDTYFIIPKRLVNVGNSIQDFKLEARSSPGFAVPKANFF